MSSPEPAPDLSAEADAFVEATDNGLRPDDPPEEQQPPQDPTWLPDGTRTAGGIR